MKTDRQRPRGRRSLLRGVGLALLALVAPGSATDAIGAPLEAPVDRFAVPLPAGALTPGVDGGMWALGAAGAGSGALRIAADGSVSRFGTALPAVSSASGAAVLSDGSLAQLRERTLVRVTPAGDLDAVAAGGRDGRRARARRRRQRLDGDHLPDRVGGAADRAGRAGRPRHALETRAARLPGRRRLRPLVGADDRRGRLRLGRQRLPGPRRARDRRRPPAAVAERAGAQILQHRRLGDRPIAIQTDADGGLRYEGGRITPAGRLIRGASSFVPELVTPDGSGWLVDTVVRQQLPDGSTRTIDDFGDPRWSAMGNGVVGADGNLWLTVGWVHSGRGFYSAEQVQIARVTPAGEVATTPLFPPSREPVPVGGEALQWPPTLTAGSDAPVWVTRAAFDGAGATTELTRVGWSGAAPPAPVPQLSIPRTIARDGARTWLQLACTVRPGRFCSGTVRLVRRDGTVAAGGSAFAVPGGERRPALLRLRLTAAERRALRRGRALRLTAVATVAGGGEQRHAVTIPPPA